MKKAAAAYDDDGGGSQARSQAEATKPGLQHKFGNLTLFSTYT